MMRRMMKRSMLFQYCGSGQSIFRHQTSKVSLHHRLPQVVRWLRYQAFRNPTFRVALEVNVLPPGIKLRHSGPIADMGASS